MIKCRGIIILITCVGLELVSLVLQVLGVSLSSWKLTTENDRTNFQIGVWYYTVCVDEVCHENPTSEYQSSGGRKGEILGINFVVIQTLTTLAIVCTLAVFILLLVLLGISRTMKRTSKVHRAGIAIGTLLSLLAGILSIVASGIFGEKMLEARDQSLKAGKENILLFPTALVLNGIGGVLSQAVFFTLVVYICCIVARKDNCRNSSVILAPIKQDYGVYQIQNGGYVTSVQPHIYQMYSLRCLGTNGSIATSSLYGDYTGYPRAPQEQLDITNRYHSNVQFAHHLPRRDFVRISYHKRDDFALSSL